MLSSDKPKITCSYCLRRQDIGDICRFCRAVLIDITENPYIISHDLQELEEEELEGNYQ